MEDNLTLEKLNNEINKHKTPKMIKVKSIFYKQLVKECKLITQVYIPDLFNDLGYIGKFSGIQIQIDDEIKNDYEVVW